jgi:hypothetical protein
MVIAVSRIFHGIAETPSPHRTASGRTPKDETITRLVSPSLPMVSQLLPQPLYPHAITPIALRPHMKRNHESNLLIDASSKISSSMQNMFLRRITFPRNRWLSPLLRTCISRWGTDFSEIFYSILPKLQFEQSVSRIQEDLADRTKIQK